MTVDDERAARTMLADLTAGQPPAPPDRLGAVRRRAVVRRRRQFAALAAVIAIVAVAAATIPLRLLGATPAPIAPALSPLGAGTAGTGPSGEPRCDRRRERPPLEPDHHARIVGSFSGPGCRPLRFPLSRLGNELRGRTTAARVRYRRSRRDLERKPVGHRLPRRRDGPQRRHLLAGQLLQRPGAHAVSGGGLHRPVCALCGNREPVSADGHLRHRIRRPASTWVTPYRSAARRA